MIAIDKAIEKYGELTNITVKNNKAVVPKPSVTPINPTPAPINPVTPEPITPGSILPMTPRPFVPKPLPTIPLIKD